MQMTNLDNNTPNSDLAIEFMSTNKRSLITQFQKNVPAEAVEDFITELSVYLIEKPRYIPDIKGWVYVSLRSKVLQYYKYNVKFTESLDVKGESIIDKLESPFNFSDQIERLDEISKKFNLVKNMINDRLTEIQRNSLMFFFENEYHKDNLSKVHYNRSIQKLRKLVDSPLYQSKKYTEEKKRKIHQKRGFGELKRGRKPGYKSTGKVGRKSSVSPETIDKMVNNVVISNGYIQNISQLSKEFKLSTPTITKYLKTRIPELNGPRKKRFSLDFLKNSAKNFSSRRQWQTAFPTHYQGARQYGWLNECCGHMKNKT